MIEWFMLVLGIAGLIVGADAATEGAKRIAHKFHLSELIIGLTIMGIGTSLPEIATNIAAGAAATKSVNASGIAIGNILGSEIANLTIVLGICALFGVIRASKKSIKREGSMLFAAFFIMLFASLDGIIVLWEAVFMAGVFIAYLVVLALEERHYEGPRVVEKSNGALDALLVAFGIALLILSSSTVVESGVFIARKWHLSELFIGLLIGLGTSLPELSLSLRAVTKGMIDISVGNLIGSNITDPLFSLSLGIFANVMYGGAGILVDYRSFFFDFPMWFLATALTLYFFWKHGRIAKTEGIVLIGLYALFIIAHMTVL